MTSPKITPMIRQYLSIKEKHADAILFYRMGDFYEMFFEDAHTASGILDIALTARNKKEAVPVPMCGVPVKAAKGYIARLIENGRKVAICEQVEDPAQAKGLVRREVTRVISPGMIVEDELLDEKSDNYLLALDRQGARVGMSFLDISTGDFRVSETDDENAVFEEILRVSPSEILLSEDMRDDSLYSRLSRLMPEKRASFLNGRAFDYERSRRRLLALFKTRSLEGFGCGDMKAGVGAAGALVHYIHETQGGAVEHFTRITPHTLNDCLVLDDVTCRNLELVVNTRTGRRSGTLLSVMDRTATPMGARLIKKWIRRPLTDPGEIALRHDAVEEALENVRARSEIRAALKNMRDFERLGSRISMGHANARDLLALKNSIMALPDVLSRTSLFSAALFEFPHDPAELYRLADLIDSAIREDAPPVTHQGNMIRPGHDEELDELDKISRDGKAWLLELESREKEKTGAASLKVRFNKVFGYYIEISKGQSRLAPPHYIRKQTLVNAERYITDELKTFESKALGAQERKAALERDIFERVRKEAAARNRHIFKAARFLARIDCLAGLAEAAAQNEYTRPEVNGGGVMDIRAGRHPVVEKTLSGERFVPNDIRLDDEKSQVLVITGPNMAGKSTILRQTALMVIMAQAGSFVPADRALISATDRIFTRVGALDNLSAGQSTFMVEMEETANIIHNATPKSLVVMDEIGRGTSTFDGISIAWAVAERLHDLDGKGVKTLFATHYHELTELSAHRPRIQNHNIAVKEWNDGIIFLRKLVRGGANRSYGIQVAKLAGLPPGVIQKAERILFRIEKDRETAGVGAPPPGDLDEPGPGDLFQNPEIHAAMERLKSLDISRLTPIEALNRLDELQKELKRLT